MSTLRAKIEIPAARAEAANEVLLEHGVAGWSLLEDVIVRKAWIVGLFTGKEEAEAAWTELRPKLPFQAPADAGWRRLAARRWRDAYKAHFRAWTCGRLHWVPVWERESFRLPRGHAVLWLDPGMAFGTGNHETTRLCCERLVALASGRAKPKRVIDAGCGSGILALSAAKLGCPKIDGFDLDPVAVQVSRKNARLNGLGRRVRFFAADLAGGLGGREADLVMANIQADVLMAKVEVLVAAIAPGGTLVLSGILAAERDRVRQVFAAAAPGWRSRSRKLGEWCDVVLRRP